MKYYWVNQGATYAVEKEIGGLWAPVISKSGAVVPSWEGMADIEAGDIIFNYAKGAIQGYCIARCSAVSMSRPYDVGAKYEEFQGGRFVYCEYISTTNDGQDLTHVTRDMVLSHEELVALLSEGDVPVLTKETEKASQRVAQKYLCPLAEAAGLILMSLLVNHGEKLTVTNVKQLKAHIKPKRTFDKTTALRMTEARVGQGYFRERLVEHFKGVCPLTGLSQLALLRASHIQSWSVSNDEDRLNIQNGLLLAAGVDAAFDRGLIWFESTGELKSVLGEDELKAIGLHKSDNYLSEDLLTPARVNFLKWHRDKFEKVIY